METTPQRNKAKDGGTKVANICFNGGLELAESYL
jgi:hypothetical protein